MDFPDHASRMDFPDRAHDLDIPATSPPLLELLKTAWAAVAGIWSRLFSYLPRLPRADRELVEEREEQVHSDARVQTRPRTRGGLSCLYGSGSRSRGKPSRTITSETAPSSPGQEVKEIQGLYKEYCRQSANCSSQKAVCHFCVFEGKRIGHCVVPHSGMFLHCSNVHKEVGKQCPMPGCCVRVLEEELAHHVHFCHELPKGWWQSM